MTAPALPAYRLYFDPEFSPVPDPSAGSRRPSWVLDGYDGDHPYWFEAAREGRLDALDWAARRIGGTGNDLVVVDWQPVYLATQPAPTYHGETPVVCRRSRRVSLTLLDGDVLTYTPATASVYQADMDRIGDGTGMITIPGTATLIPQTADLDPPGAPAPAQTYRLVACRHVVLVDVEVFLSPPMEVPR